MRICLSSIHPRPLSGQIEALAGLAKELKGLGHKVEVVSAFGSELIGGDRLTLAERDGRLLVGKLGRIVGILTKLVKQARSADLIHLNLPTPAFAILGDILQELVSIPVIVGFEAHLAGTGRPLWVSDLRASPYFYLPRLLLNNGLTARCTLHRATLYTVSSRYQAAELHRLGFPQERVLVLPSVIETGKLQRLDQADARRLLGLPDSRLIAYVGHYHHVKGVDILVKAFGLLARQQDDCRLVLAWSGLGDRRPIEQAVQAAGVEDRVLWLGRVRIGTIMSAIDVLVLPYRYTMGQNAYPGLILEAMAVGVPMVTSDLPLLQELLEHERTAMLVSPGDATAVAWGINRLLQSKLLRSEMIAEQRRRFFGSLNPKEVARRYVQVYRQVCTGEAVILQPAGREPELRSPAL